MGTYLLLRDIHVRCSPVITFIMSLSQFYTCRGQLIAQSLSAARATLPAFSRLHSTHCYFHRPGDDDTPALYYVEAIKDTFKFATRRVTAVQNGNGTLVWRNRFTLPLFLLLAHHTPLFSHPHPSTPPPPTQSSSPPWPPSPSTHSPKSSRRACPTSSRSPRTTQRGSPQRPAPRTDTDTWSPHPRTPPRTPRTSPPRHYQWSPPARTSNPRLSPSPRRTLPLLPRSASRTQTHCPRCPQ